MYLAVAAAALLLSTRSVGGEHTSVPPPRPSVLFCAPHGLFASERTWVGLTYLRSLHNSSQPGGGFEVDWTESLADITRARIWRYNAIVLWVSPGSGAVVPNPFPGPFRASFVGVILDYVAAGGGLLLFPTETNQYAQQLFDLTSRLGARLPVETLEESNVSNVAVMDHMQAEGDSVKVFWTDAVNHTALPLAAGVNQVWYPSMPMYNAAHGGPIDVDGNWSVVLSGSATTRTTPVNLSASTVRLPLPPANQIFQRKTPVYSPPLFAVRELGNGRVALLNQWRQYTTGSGSDWLFDSQVLSTGAKGRPSDMGRLLRNSFQWLTEPTVRRDSPSRLPQDHATHSKACPWGNCPGGYRMPLGHLDNPNNKTTVLKDFAELHLSYDVATLGNDPADSSLTLRRGVVGVRSSFTTGADTVAAIAQAARTSKLDFVIILEEYNATNSTRLTNATLMDLAAACVTHSSGELALFPGYTIRDNIGSKVFVWGPSSAVPHMFPTPDVLTPDGSRLLVQPTDPANHSRFNGHANLGAFSWLEANSQSHGYQVGYYHLGETRPAGSRPMQDLNAYSMAAIRYYQGGELIEDLLADYKLTSQSTIPPVPVVLSEITSAAELTAAVTSGQALTYVRMAADDWAGLLASTGVLGWNNQYTASSVFVSDGPIIKAWGEVCTHQGSAGAERFLAGRATDIAGLSVQRGRDAAPLATVSLWDGTRLFRKFSMDSSQQDSFHHTFVLEGWLHRNIVLVVTDTAGKTAVSFPRRHWKSGIHSIEFCSDHLNDCSADDTLLAHGPYTSTVTNVGILPASVSGYTWDGGPVAELGLLLFTEGGASVAKVTVYTSGSESESSNQMAQTPVLEGGDEGAIAVQDRHNRIFSPLIENVINYGNTFGPEEPGNDSSKLIDVTFRHIEYFSASTAFPVSGFAGLPTAVGSVATIWQARTVFKQALNATRLAFLRQDNPPPVGQVFVLYGDSSADPAINHNLINTSNLTGSVGVRIPHGGWWAVFSLFDSNSHVFFVNGASLDIAVKNPATPGSWFAVTRESQGLREPQWPLGLQGISAGDELNIELVHYGVSLLTQVASSTDMLDQIQALVNPNGLRLVRGTQQPIANRSHGLLDLVANESCGCVELSVDQNVADAHALLPLRVAGMCENWTAGYLQKEGWSLGNYGNGTNRYSALAIDSTSSVHVPLYTGLSKHDVLVGHPITLILDSASVLRPCEAFVQVTHVDSVPGVSDIWHVSVQNPTSQALTAVLQINFGLPGLTVAPEKMVVKLAPGQMLDIM